MTPKQIINGLCTFCNPPFSLRPQEKELVCGDDIIVNFLPAIARELKLDIKDVERAHEIYGWAGPFMFQASLDLLVRMRDKNFNEVVLTDVT